MGDSMTVNNSWLDFSAKSAEHQTTTSGCPTNCPFDHFLAEKNALAGNDIALHGWLEVYRFTKRYIKETILQMMGPY